MINSNIPFAPVPAEFHKESTSYVIDNIQRGKSIQLVGIPGSGKSMFLRSLANKTDSQLKFVYLDLHLAHEKSPGLLVSFIQPHLEISPTHKLVMILDSFNELATNPEKYRETFDWLNGIYNQFRGGLVFIFATEFPITDFKALFAMGKLANLVTEVIYYLPFLSTDDAKWFAKECAKSCNLQLKDSEIETLLSDSGRHPQTLKRLIEAHEEPNAFRLQFHFERMKQYTDKYSGRPDLLRNMGIKDESNNWTIPAFEKYITSRQQLPADSFTEKLTASEIKAYDLLKANTGVLVSRDDLITCIWGDLAEPDISDHALDQLIHRLKIKLEQQKMPEKIITLRGRGHKLVSI